MSAIERYDAVIIGSGPGGYAAGIRLGQLGVKTAVIERETPGGVCLNVGCIPSKALIHAAKTYEKMSSSASMGITLSAPPTLDMDAMQTWKRGVVTKLTRGVAQLLKSAGTKLVRGTGRLAGHSQGRHRVEVSGEDACVIEAEHVVVATGSRPIEIPGFAVDGERVLDSTGALALTRVPDHLVVIGGGYIGLELGTVYAKLGSKVTVVEALDSVLAGMEPECVAVVARKLRKKGVEVLTGARAKAWRPGASASAAVLSIDTAKGPRELETDAILVSVGRRPNSENLGLAEAGVQLDERGFIPVDAALRTNVAGIYAIGDVAGGVMLAHKATKEAEVVAEVIAGHDEVQDARTIPAVVFTDPEIASAGMTEAQARAAGHEDLKIGKFPFAALGRALSVDDTDGFAKVIGDARSGEILGVHVVGTGASDLISEAALAIESGSELRDLALTVHPHPTLSESLKEAAAAALGEAIHIVNR
ncbi:dihydrolipoyl dehydrogenase [Haliangium ochraceum]|uniref:Dihydrolipoyl dehydrogenase n=1 Tax=Haliangium ochraceum (strain DSM 14365 / JCM 11303 / SMP-2) TaxID=502025 RepID=D0LTP2_HALO1|nr:dihydrolipoyl dehydrogenase [Haliangium ochraceum]ACY15736.1 dihydrolipoamide dehydrogenase [Haliangium ochraceum DSM 14365]